MHVRIQNARSVSLILLLAISACSGKKRDFADGNVQNAEANDAGGSDSTSRAPADSPETRGTDSSGLGSMGSDVSQGSAVCDDSGNCSCDDRAESCEATALCTNGEDVCDETCPGCLIEGNCVEPRAVDPANPCLICDPTRSSQDWSSNEGATCDDGFFCTASDACIAGECTGAALICDDDVACNGVSTCDESADACSAPTNQCPSGQVCNATTDSCTTTCDGCLINDVCFSAGSERAGDPCMVCEPGASTTSFTPAFGKSCGAAATACSLADTCDAQGLCQPNHLSSGSACGDPASGFCNQSDACDGNGACSPRITANTTPCDDGSFCTVGDQCQGGQCVSVSNRNCGTDLACDEAADQCRCQGCVIGNRCVARGTVNAANPCQICDPARSGSAFSPNANATCGAGSTECSGQDTCNAQGQCQSNDFPPGTRCSSVPGGSCTNAGRCLDLLAGRPPVLLADIERGIGGFGITGAREFDVAGTAVGGGGDINGDGLDDVLIGAPAADRGDLARTGRAYVVFGGARSALLPLTEIESGRGGFAISGTDADEALGQNVEVAGDVNGDSLADIVVGSLNTARELSAAYVVFGRRTTAEVLASAVRAGTESGFAILSVPGDERLGRIGAGAGDVNGDGLADIVIDVQGQAAGARVVFGRSSIAPVDSANLQGGGFAVLHNDGLSDVSGAGDVNGDGLDDIIVGDSAPSSGAGAGAGRAYVVFGKATRTAVALSNLEAGSGGGFVINGVRVGDNAGGAVSGAGDVNGDGLADVIVGAPFAPANGNVEAGRAYVVFGKANGDAVALASVESGVGGFVINGANSGDRAASDVAAAGDLNADGLDDVLIGAEFASPNGVSNAGASYVVFGKPDGTAVALAGFHSEQRGGFAILGVNTTDYAGAAVASGGDVDGNGVLDLLIGSPLASRSGQLNKGISCVLLSPAR